MPNEAFSTQGNFHSGSIYNCWNSSVVCLSNLLTDLSVWNQQPLKQTDDRYFRKSQRLPWEGFCRVATNSPQREPIPYICGLRARIECEPVSEHSTRSDRVTDIGDRFSLRASVLPLPSPDKSTFYFGIPPSLCLRISF